MHTETATLLAVLATPLAVLALVVALLVGLLARRGRRSLASATARLEAGEAAVRHDLTRERASLVRAAAAAASLRRQGDRLDTDLAAWAAGLAAGRSLIERVTHGRLGPAVRAMQLAGALARVALLWRTPAR